MMSKQIALRNTLSDVVQKQVKVEKEEPKAPPFWMLPSVHANMVQKFDGVKRMVPASPRLQKCNRGRKRMAKDEKLTKGASVRVRQSPEKLVEVTIVYCKI